MTQLSDRHCADTSRPCRGRTAAAHARTAGVAAAAATGRAHQRGRDRGATARSPPSPASTAGSRCCDGAGVALSLDGDELAAARAGDPPLALRRRAGTACAGCSTAPTRDLNLMVRAPPARSMRVRTPARLDAARSRRCGRYAHALASGRRRWAQSRCRRAPRLVGPRRSAGASPRCPTTRCACWIALASRRPELQHDAQPCGATRAWPRWPARRRWGWIERRRAARRRRSHRLGRRRRPTARRRAHRRRARPRRRAGHARADRLPHAPGLRRPARARVRAAAAGRELRGDRARRRRHPLDRRRHARSQRRHAVRRRAPARAAR